MMPHWTRVTMQSRSSGVVAPWPPVEVVAAIASAVTAAADPGGIGPVCPDAPHPGPTEVWCRHGRAVSLMEATRCRLEVLDGLRPRRLRSIRRGR